MTDTQRPARVQSPEERELELRRQELATLEAELVEQELHLSTLQAELAVSNPSTCGSLGAGTLNSTI